LTAGPAAAAPTTFTDIARDPSSGITYRRAPSTIKANEDAGKLRPFVARPEMYAMPFKWHGQPGVAVLDYDNDGDEDVYVTNGPGRANSLYRSQFKQTGQVTFVDVGATSGAAATDMDSTGVCYGDIDNDGDADLFVLGRMEPNRLFRNNGDRTFTDITATAAVGGGSTSHTSCAMGDINNDGLLDIVVSNTWDWARLEPIFDDFYSFNHPNDLYLNQGGNRFSDVSQSSGIQVLYSVPENNATISWQPVLVDYDQDGDVDLMHADDQGAMAPTQFANIDRGFIQTFRNDGRGNFTNVTGASGSLARTSSWMGFAFGDLNCDGHMDFFASSGGDYIAPLQGFPIPPGFQSSRWHLGSASGVFTDSAEVGPGVQGLAATPFGWGTGSFDYDNDGDTDIIFYGSLGAPAFHSADNPGVMLQNQGCQAQFTWDQGATAATAEFVLRQEVHGVALGDLNDDGFQDVVYASGLYINENVPLIPMPVGFGGPLDATAFFLPTFMTLGPVEWEWSGVEAEEDGFMGVKINSATSGNRWVKVRVKGSKGLTSRGKVNRDGIGAVVKFKPAGGKQVMYPVLGGSSHASQHSLTQGFGLGSATRGTVEILWPGGVKNRLYDVAAGERVMIPEIPCSFVSTPWSSKTAYRKCVDDALTDLVQKQVISGAMRNRLRTSALKAFDEG
jgi:hypothetical protein